MIYKNLSDTTPSIYINSIGLINASGTCSRLVLDAYFAGISFVESCAPLGSIARLGLDGIGQVEMLQQQKHLKDYDDACLLGVAAARQVATMIKDLTTCAVVVGSSRGAATAWERELGAFLADEPLSLTASPSTTMGSFASSIARDLATGGLQTSVSAACATSMQATALGVALLRSGQCESAIVGGSELATTAFTVSMLKRVKVYQSNPSFGYRPFHKQSSGMVLGDGGAVLLLSRDSENALGEVMGVGSASERASLTGLNESGAALATAIQRALNNAAISAEDIEAIVAHGSGTKKGDAAELAAYRRVFGDKNVPITFDKWCFGHTLGAASTTSIAIGLEISCRGLMPSILGSTELPGTVGRAATIGRGAPVLIASLGFGGSAGAVVVRAY